MSANTTLLPYTSKATDGGAAPLLRPNPRPLDLTSIKEKIDRGERLNLKDGVRLFESDDILTIGRLADRLRQERVGDNVYFINNRQLNPTNICWNSCKFCAFSKKEVDEGAYVMSFEQMEEKVAGAVEAGAVEIHIVGGEHPRLPYSWYMEILERLHTRWPSLHLKTFTASEIKHLARIGKKTTTEVLGDLKHRGVSGLPGGGAEIFGERVRKLVCGAKLTGQEWLEIHRQAHKAGLRTNATMLYGHWETFEERVDHMLQLRDLQDETGGFMCFIPLAYQPENNRIRDAGWTTGMEDLKTIAISRLLLDNFHAIKAYWIMLGLKISQMALAFGANDIDGTILEERISHAAGARSNEGVAKADLVALIKNAGRIPVERDTLYRPLHIYS